MKRSRVFFLLVVAVACLAWWFQPRQSAHETSTTSVQTSHDTTEVVEPLRPVTTADAPQTRVQEKGCLTLAQAERSPEVFAEMRRRDPIDVRGPAIETFRGVTHKELENFAEAGDAGAMVVLASRLALSAVDRDPDYAIDALDKYEMFVFLQPRVIHDLDLELLAQAQRWYYEAALHGRVAALTHFGRIKWLAAGRSISLDGISAQEIAALDKDEMYSLEPGFFFPRMTFDLHPELRDGPFGGIEAFFVDSPIAQRLRARFIEKFTAERNARGLRPAVIPPSVLSVETFMDQLCASDRERIEREEDQRTN